MAADTPSSPFVRLYELGLISEAQRKAAEAHVGAAGFSGDDELADILAWMVERDFVRPGSLAALAAADEARRVRDTALRLLGLRAAVARKHSYWRSLLLGAPRVLLSSFIFLVICYVGYLRSKANASPDVDAGVHAIPACDASETLHMVQSSVFTALIGFDGGHPGTPAVRQIREAGYAPGHRQRGCTATLQFGYETIPYAYVVGALASDKGRVGVMGAHPAIVEARFQLRGDGRNLQNADPVGRSNLGAALRRGVDAIVTGRRMHAHLHEIADIEPLASCREIEPGMRYGCPVLIVRNDPLHAAAGVMRSHTLRAEFNFERDAASGRWRVSDDFPNAYWKAVAGASI